ncbi:MAG: hydantoinase B/oxoprolinase family protein [Chloroflexi bacterium]|nr:hydantoinase B/oxoprolinase family protein [Chloroflexota bacterium]
MQRTFDAIELEVLWNRVVSIAQEQAKTLIRCSFTTLIGEMEDMACGLFDPQGSLFAQGVAGTQGIIVGMGKGVQAMLQKYPAETLAPGDVLIGNDPWLFAGHKYDITVASPVFAGDRLVAVAASILHCTDIGGITSAADSNNVYEEGLLVPVMKLMSRGRVNQDLLDIIESNVRVPRQVTGDLMAQVSANKVAGHKLVEFVQEYGLPDLQGLTDAIVSTSERAVRQAIAAIPDGVYHHEIMIDGVDEPLKIAVTMTIRGDDLLMDFTGTSPQTERGGINSVLNHTMAWVHGAIKSSLVPEIPNNEGFFRAYRVVAPEGCLANAVPPAPVMAKYSLVVPLSAVCFGVLSKAIPQSVIADGSYSTMVLVTGKDETGERFLQWLVSAGGTGARPDKDGYAATIWPANIANVPVEIVENVSPLFLVAKEFVPDSGGAGKFRGGNDLRHTFKVRSPYPAVVNLFFDRTKFPALGYQGGRNGRPAELVVNGHERLKPKQKYVLQPGDEFSFCFGGGGGYYPPEQRDPELVLRDVVNGQVSVDSARRDYRVAIDPPRRAVDREETKRLRATG